MSSCVEREASGNPPFQHCCRWAGRPQPEWAGLLAWLTVGAEREPGAEKVVGASAAAAAGRRMVEAGRSGVLVG